MAATKLIIVPLVIQDGVAVNGISITHEHVVVHNGGTYSGVPRVEFMKAFVKGIDDSDWPTTPAGALQTAIDNHNATLQTAIDSARQTMYTNAAAAGVPTPADVQAEKDALDAYTTGFQSRSTCMKGDNLNPALTNGTFYHIPPMDIANMLKRGQRNARHFVESSKLMWEFFQSWKNNFAGFLVDTTTGANVTLGETDPDAPRNGGGTFGPLNFEAVPPGAPRQMSTFNFALDDLEQRLAEMLASPEKMKTDIERFRKDLSTVRERARQVVINGNFPNMTADKTTFGGSLSKGSLPQKNKKNVTSPQKRTKVKKIVKQQKS